MDGNFFFVLGIILVLAAVGLAFLGIRSADSFPPRRAVLVGVTALFAVLVGTTMAFAIVKSKDEQDKRNAELAKEGEQAQPANAGAQPTSPGGQPQASSGGNQQPPATTGGGGGGATASTIDISTPPGSDLAYDQKDVSAKAGSVTIDFDNKQAQPHDVAVEDSSGKELGATQLVSSGTSNTTLDLTAGTYTFFCTVPGHREAGMEGDLTVTGG